MPPPAVDSGGPGDGGGSGVREKREGGGRVRFPAAARPEAARGGLATMAGGIRWRWAGALGSMALREEGEKREMRRWGSYSPTYLGPGWSREVG